MIKIKFCTNMTKHEEIMSEDTTIRQALESQDVNYSVGITSLDGSPLKPGDMDKTFRDFGITEKCYLANVVKADNAATVGVAGSVCVISSSATYDQLALLQKHDPDALVVLKEKTPVFRVGVSKGARGDINNYGAEFGTAANAQGKATITVDVPEGTDDVKSWVADKYGVALTMLAKIEEGLTEKVTAVETQRAALLESIKTL